MRAVVQDGYGPPDVLRVADLPDPTPAADEVLVEVRAVSLNGSDRENLVGRPLYSRLGGLRRPRVPVPVPGSDVAGVVVAVGGDVSGFAAGDEVVGELPGYRGGLAGLVATRPGTLVTKPGALSFVEASTVPQAGCIALRARRHDVVVRACEHGRMSTLPEDVVHLTLTPGGDWVGGGAGPDEMVGAAVVAQLVLDRVVTVVGDRAVPTGRPAELHAEVSGALGASGCGLAELVAAAGPAVKDAVVHDLDARGLLRVERSRVLGLLPVTRIRDVDPSLGAAARERVESVLARPSGATGSAEDAATAVLVAILDAGGVLQQVAAAPAERVAQVRRIVGSGATGSAVKEVEASLDALLAALVVTILVPTAFLGTGG